MYYADLIKDLEVKIDQTCNSPIFNNDIYNDLYSKYRDLKDYERALDNSLRHNRIIIGMYITGATVIQQKINYAVAYNQ